MNKLKKWEIRQDKEAVRYRLDCKKFSSGSFNYKEVGDDFISYDTDFDGDEHYEYHKVMTRLEARKEYVRQQKLKRDQDIQMLNDYKKERQENINTPQEKIIAEQVLEKHIEESYDDISGSIENFKNYDIEEDKAFKQAKIEYLRKMGKFSKKEGYKSLNWVNDRAEEIRNQVIDFEKAAKKNETKNKKQLKKEVDNIMTKYFG